MYNILRIQIYCASLYITQHMYNTFAVSKYIKRRIWCAYNTCTTYANRTAPEILKRPLATQFYIESY